jgi:signal transduction histidine kinase
MPVPTMFPTSQSDLNAVKTYAKKSFPDEKVLWCDGSEDHDDPRKLGEFMKSRAGDRSDAMEANAPREARGRLFRKYVALFVAVISVALIANGLFQIWFDYNAERILLVRIQRQQAEAAALRISQFIKEIEGQLAWATQLPWSIENLEEWRFDTVRLLRQVPAITEVTQLDSSGRAQARMSRFSMDAIGSQNDFSADPAFVGAVANKIYYGPVRFIGESQPHMTLAMAGIRREYGVIVAEVSLEFIWDVVSEIKVGQHGEAYVVDPQGRLIAHPDISLVLRNTDLSGLDQVRAALAAQLDVQEDTAPIVRDVQDRQVLSAHTRIGPLGWLVFVDLPVEEAYAPLYASIQRSGTLLIGALLLAAFAGLYLARRMVIPIRALREGAARIGSGDLSRRITIKTGDELEALGNQFNSMAARLQDSYATLERKVEERTRELAQSVEELRALGEVSQAVNSTLDLETVLDTIVAKAVQLSGADAGTMYVFDEASGEFRLRAAYGMSEELIATLEEHHAGLSDWIAKSTDRRAPMQVADLRDESLPPVEQAAPVQQIVLEAGYRARMTVPLVGADRVLGVLVVRRKTTGAFPDRTMDLLQTFAAQSVLAIQNARLFREIEVKGHQLEVASRHKSQFLANMSHELRTPLNAILGYAELILDNIYGDMPQRMRGVLERVQSNGKHLLGLINDVLDLSKIEAGQLTLSLDDYSIGDVVQNVVTLVEPLATEKSLALTVDLPGDLPTAHGDQRRLTQVLLNLVGNAIKFTDSGEVAIKAAARNGAYTLSVRDTGPGIAPADQSKIFEEFQQADSSSTKTKRGTGLGLSIARRIVTMHGGQIWVESAPGSGSTFFIKVPVNVQQQVGHI